MPFTLLFAAFTLVLDLLRAATGRQQDLAVEVVVLRQHVRMYQRKARRAPRVLVDFSIRRDLLAHGEQECQDRAPDGINGQHSRSSIAASRSPLASNPGRVH
jgi:hypothetical protein